MAAVKKAFSGADFLEVEIFRSSWALGGFDAMEGFGEVRSVRKTRVHGSVGLEYARWLQKIMQAHEGETVWECGDDEYARWTNERKTI